MFDKELVDRNITKITVIKVKNNPTESYHILQCKKQVKRPQTQFQISVLMCRCNLFHIYPHFKFINIPRLTHVSSTCYNHLSWKKIHNHNIIIYIRVQSCFRIHKYSCTVSRYCSRGFHLKDLLLSCLCVLQLHDVL